MNFGKCLLTLLVVEMRSGFWLRIDLTISTFPPHAAKCNALASPCKVQHAIKYRVN